MINQIIVLVIMAFATYGFFIFSYQLWSCALGLFCKKKESYQVKTMANKKLFKLVNEKVKENLISFIRSLPTDSKNPLVVCIQEMTRTLEQNARMWATLTDISEQVVWHSLKLTPEEWKHVFTATLKGQKTVPNLDGTGFIILGQSTRAMSKKELSNLLELAYAFGAENGVKWSEESKTDLLIFDWYKDQLSKVS